MKPKPKPTAEQEYFARKRNHSIILAARAQAMQREYQLLKSTSLKDLIGRKLHVL